MKERIFIIDDDPHVLSYMEEHLSIENFAVSAFQSPRKALQTLENNSDKPSLVISDVKMGEMTGDEVLNHILKNHASIGVILITGFGNITHSVNAMRKGAFDYITKPFSGQELSSRVKQFFKVRQEQHPQGAQPASEVPEAVKQQTNASIKKKPRATEKKLIGEDPNFKKLISILPQVAPTNAPVLIQGESGTGKELYASLIQQKSNRADKPFIKINCANLPSELVESTLFGHVKGAFTGAIKDSDGAFKEADGGTLLLDEITEIDINIQAKLLRVLQEKEFKKVGSQKTQKVDVRVISTSNRNIGEAISEGSFRKDLYFRLNVFPIQMPSLRERVKDIPLLARYFVNKFTDQFHLPDKEISPELRKHLLKRDWNGNVRELENYIQRGVIMSQREDVIKIEHIENPLFQNMDDGLSREVLDDIPVVTIEEMELQMIKKALEKTDGNQKEAAELLGVSDRTIRNKLKKIKFPDKE